MANLVPQTHDPAESLKTALHTAARRIRARTRVELFAVGGSQETADSNISLALAFKADRSRRPSNFNPYQLNNDEPNEEATIMNRFSTCNTHILQSPEMTECLTLVFMEISRYVSSREDPIPIWEEREGFSVQFLNCIKIHERDWVMGELVLNVGEEGELKSSHRKSLFGSDAGLKFGIVIGSTSAEVGLIGKIGYERRMDAGFEGDGVTNGHVVDADLGDEDVPDVGLGAEKQ